MARQEINIGVEGNDGTGDSLRESFKKTNENFQELYAVFGQGGTISFTSLDDTPDDLTNQENKVAIVVPGTSGNEIGLLELASNGAITGDSADDTIVFDFSQSGKVILRSTNSRVSDDANPTLGGPLNGDGNAIGNIAITDDAAIDFVGKYGGNVTIDDLVPDKKFVDENYLKRGSPGPTANLRDEPVDASAYTFTIISANGTNVTITGHGLDRGSNGAEYKYNAVATPGLNLTDGANYYIRIVDKNRISLHPTKADAVDGTNAISTTISSGVHTLSDTTYDTQLEGFWLDNEALPRKSVVRRQGDTMEGALYLNDHPGELAGKGKPNGDSDMQAATKFYVDRGSYNSRTNIYVNDQGSDVQPLTPPGREGRSPNYAFRSILKAAEKAEEIIISTGPEPGPYMQTITHSGGTATTIQSTGVKTIPAGRTDAKTIVEANREFIQEEVIAYINSTFPDFEYDSLVCARDVGLILDSVILDALTGNNANYLSRFAGLQYFARPSGQVAIKTQYTETIAGINYAKSLVNQALNGLTITPLQTLYDQTLFPSITIDQTTRDAIDAKFEIVKDVINDGALDAPEIVDGSVVEVNISNGGQGFVDQGISTNTDLLPGKVIRGKTSGALGKIVAYIREEDPATTTPAGQDILEVVLMRPIEFENNEELEYGNFVSEQQITILVEAGTYYEDYPIKVPANVSVVGDDFRRTIVRPKNRVSHSRYANTYFYRDKEFDNLTGDANTSITGYADTNLPTDGTPYINPLTSNVDGYFGFHYLTDPNNPVNVSNFGKTNPGEFENASELIRRNKEFIEEEVVEYIDFTYPTLVYDRSNAKKEVGYIVDGLVNDLVEGGREDSLSNQGSIETFAVGGETETADGISYIKIIAASVLANTAFVDKRGSVDQYINTFYTAENDSLVNLDSLVDCITFAFDSNFNPPKPNTEMDVFMMNDATRLCDLTVQGHGGFMTVLDPEGQILTKSPYIQVGSSFSQSVNRQAFRGGMLVDAYTGNVPMEVYAKDDPYSLDVRSPVGEGLRIRAPKTPCPFYIDGKRFQVNAVREWDKIQGTATLLLDVSSNDGNGFTGVTSGAPTGVDLDDLASPIDITVQTGGNRSMLGNDFTQINDLGYGLLVMNGGLSEMVSMFTYYCWSAFYAYNGSEIRSLNGSNGYGEYGLVAEGADPNEIPDAISLRDNMVMPAKTAQAEVILEFAAENPFAAGASATSSGGASGTVVFTDNNKKVYLKDVTGTFATGDTVTIGGSNLGNPSNVDAPGLTNAATQQSAFIYDLEHPMQNNGEVDIHHPTVGIGRYEVSNISKVTDFIVQGYFNVPFSGGTGSNATFTIKKTQNGYVPIVNAIGSGYTQGDTLTISGAVLGGGTPTNDCTLTVDAVGTGGNIVSVSAAGTPQTDIDTPRHDGQVFKINFSSGGSGFSADGLEEATPEKANVTLRQNQNFVIGDIANRDKLTIRPSTAFVFNESEETTYRTIAFATTDSVGEELDITKSLITFDASYDYVKLFVEQTEINNNTHAGSGTTMGGTAGDVVIAIGRISDQDEIDRINNNDMIFGWDGKMHVVSNYVDRGTFATVEIADLADSDLNVPATATGIASALTLPGNAQVTLRTGLQSSEPGTITINISTCRATGHDFLDIGSGSFNQTNYPNVLLGDPRQPDQANEVQERNKGRVFYVSTDQDGFFRVGRFFTVDQGTGTVSFAASIALSNLDGLGFKRGVVINEFSTDTAMANNAVDIVPTQSATRGYVNRRLGWDHEGNIVSNRIGPGAVALDGTTAFEGNMNAGSFTVTNLSAPNNGSDAATKAYVDGIVGDNDTFDELKDTFINTYAADQIIITTGLNRIIIDADNIGGSGTFQNGQTIDGSASGAQGTIVSVEASNDPVLGNIQTIAYTPVSGAFTTSDTISVTSGPNAPLIDGPFKEYTNADYDEAGSQIEFSATRTETDASVQLLIKDGTVLNADVAANAAIAQSKLAMQAATTRANATGISQSDLGLASFDANNFDATNGWISLATNGITLADIQQINTNTVLGRVSSGVGNVEQLGITTTGEADKIVRTQSDGSIRVTSLRLGGDNTYQIASLSGTTLNLKTPGQATILSASGSDATMEVNMPANLDIGNTGTAESILKQNSSLNGESALGVDWIYSSFIEAPGEKNTASTGIAIGANTGKSLAGEVSIVVAGTGASVIPAKFDDSGITPDTTNTYNIGTNTLRYNTVYATVFNGTATSARYADLAENYLGDADYEPGTVLVFGGEQEVTVCAKKGDQKVAGVVTTNPAHLMNSALEGDSVVGLALQGRVPCKVIGKVAKGDMLVTSAVPGYAIVDNNPTVGTVIGKAVGTKDNDDRGIVEVVVGRV